MTDCRRRPGKLVGVHLGRLRLRDFRNYARLDVEFSPGFHLLLGGKAQGKTNVLEAIYLLATLRSFRGFGGAVVLGQGGHEIRMYWSADERKLSLDDRPVRKLTDYLGVLRVVVICTE